MNLTKLDDETLAKVVGISDKVLSRGYNLSLKAIGKGVENDIIYIIYVSMDEALYPDYILDKLFKYEKELPDGEYEVIFYGGEEIHGEYHQFS